MNVWKSQSEWDAVIAGANWRIDGMRALTENSEDEFWEQPVEVKSVTRVIPAHEVTEYVEVEK